MGKTILVSAATVVLTIVALIGIAYSANIFQVDRDGTVRLVISDTGNVGIGAESPGSRLTVRGSGTTSTTSGLDVQAGDGTSRVFVRDDGNVGVGTTGPQGILDMRNNARGIIMAGGTGGGGDESFKIQAIRAVDPSDYRGLSFQPLGGNVGIGTAIPTSKLHVVGLPLYANNAAAVAGGLTPGAFYRTGGDPDLICVVH